MNSREEKKRLHRAGATALLCLFIAMLACRSSFSDPQPPVPAVPVSEEAAQKFIDAYTQAIHDPTPGSSFQIAFGEAELTSWLILQQNGWPLQDIQITFAREQIRLYGELSVGGLLSGALLEMRPTLSPAGQLDLTLVAAHFGPERLPLETMERLVADLQEAIAALLDAAPLPYRLETLAIMRGELTLGGVWLSLP